MSDVGKIYLGGIPMIADDMMTFIKSDIVVFGLGVLLFIIATLWFVFRKLIWIIVPISSCLFSVDYYDGITWYSWMESNRYFIELYRTNVNFNNGNEYTYEYSFLQLRKDFPTKNNFEIISLTTDKMFWPIIYTVFTTVLLFYL